jgi:hypothetical protein
MVLKGQKWGAVAVVTAVISIIAAVVVEETGGIENVVVHPIIIPYAKLADSLFYYRHQWLSTVFGLSQFPVYGFVLGRAWFHQRLWQTLLRLACVHLLIAALAIGHYLYFR